jgi:hypothetical protein
MEEKGRRASVEGFANEMIVCGLLMKKYTNVSLVDLPLSPYDIIVVIRGEDGSENIIRVQTRTAKKGINFVGGRRGGQDRIIRSRVKEYVQSPKTADCIVGISFEDERPQLYFVPTVLIEMLGAKSISLSRIKGLKNNYSMLERCKDIEFVKKKAREYGILP